MTTSDRTVETHKEPVRRIQTGIFDEGNVDRVDELVADDFLGHVPPTPGELRGPEGFKQLVTAFRTGLSDLSHPEISLVGERDTVVTWVNGTGTHEGEFQQLGAVREV